jgi:hypothetical protein
MTEHDQPSDEPAQQPKPADTAVPRPEPAADRPATGRSYFPASPITPGRWNPTDLRIRRTIRRSP